MDFLLNKEKITKQITILVSSKKKKKNSPGSSCWNACTLGNFLLCKYFLNSLNWASNVIEVNYWDR